jgi:hypothetical protein
LSFSLGRQSVSAHSQFLQGSAIHSFHHSAAEWSHPPQGLIQLLLLPLLLQAEGKYSLHIFGHQLCPGSAISSPAVLKYVGPSKTDSALHLPAGIADSLRCKWVISRAVQAGSSQKFCVHTYFSRSRSSQMLADLFLKFSALCLCFNDQGEMEIRDKEKKKKERKKNSFPVGR